VNGPATGAGPLAGVRVADLTSVVMGPLATQILGDLGAEVTLIEGRGIDTNRLMGPGPHPQLSGVVLNLLRNKRSITLDIKHPEGRRALLRLAATCDVFVTNVRPAGLARAGLAYDDVRAVRPDVIYCSAHGFRQGSSRQDDPAYDDIIQAATGLADAARLQTGTPALAPTILADKVCGLTIAYAVCAALVQRARTGRGQHLEIPMDDTMAAFILAEHGAAAIPRPPLGPAGYPRILTPNRRPQRTLDGWIHVLPYARRHYDALFGAAGRTELVGDQRYATGRALIANADFLYRCTQEVMATRTTAEWLTFCRDRDIPVTEVATLEDLVAALPEEEHPVAGTYKVIPPPVRFADGPTPVRRPAPLIGQHTDEVLGELGYRPEEIEALRVSGAIPPPPEE